MKKTALVLILIAFIASISYAETSNVTVANKAAGQTALRDHAAGMKAERGVKNILFGWTEIPKSIIQVTRDSRNPIWGLTAGTFKGVGKAFPRTASGLSDLATFPLADYNKSPIKPDEWDTRVK